MAPRDTYDKKKQPAFDVIIIGAGAAGCAAALSLAPLKVALVSGGPLGGDCSSLWSQGGISASVDKAADSAALHAHDTLQAAAGTADVQVVRAYTRAAAKAIDFLEINGVQFDKDKSGFVLSKEGGHSAHRVLKAASGDSFGRTLMPALAENVAQAGHITLYPQQKAFDLLKNAAGRITGVALAQGNRVTLLQANAVVLATGGAAALYAETTNPLHNVGSGLALAARAGATLSDLEFVQFHPTAFQNPARDGAPLPLLTEALRGHGAKLYSDKTGYFMKKEHPLKDLAPRDIVSRAVFGELAAGHQVYLDCRSIDTSGFATLRENAAVAGLDPEQDMIPVAPAAHYHMGGISTDANGRTSLDGLWAIGEVAATGFHGANRLASNSLLEAVIMGRLAAGDIKKQRPPATPEGQARMHRDVTPGGRSLQEQAREDIKQKTIMAMRRCMSDYVGLVRESEQLKDALAFFEDIEQTYAGLDREIEDMALVCRLVTSAALMRRESRGGHYRSDFPESRQELGRRSYTKTVIPATAETHGYAGLQHNESIKERAL